MAHKPPLGSSRVWEDLRKEARKLEGELDVKLASYAKLCSGFEAGERGKGPGSAAATDQLAKQKAADIEALLQRLSDINHDMSGVIAGAADSRSHTLARHRDILQDLTQEFRRLDSQLGAARDRAELLAGGAENLPLLSVQVDDMLAQAQSVSRGLLEQRRIFSSVQDKLVTVGERFPAISGLLNAIRRKKSKDTLVISAVIAACLVFTIIYILSKTLADLSLPHAVKEVVDKDANAVLDEIEAAVFEVAASILQGNGFSYDIPSRSKGNQLYVPELDRIVLKDSTSKRPFASTQQCRKTAITTRILSLVHELCLKQINVTKRDLFYTDVKLFEDQGQSDAVLDDLSCMLGCTRSSLHVVASEKGVVVGRLTFTEAGDHIDCRRMGVGGKAIPPNISKVSNIASDALFILLVEKDAAFMRLAEDRFYNDYPAIIITAKGQPDVATRLFLRKLKLTLKIPVLALVDSDPYGLKILSVYMKGSMNMSYDSSNLTTPDIKWLGVRPSDLDSFNIPAQCRLSMTEEDIKTGKKLLEEDFIRSNPEWVAELELMLKKKEKAEIQALSSFGFQYLSQVYLPLKLQEGDWI
eukprot:gene4035-4282_t